MHPAHMFFAFDEEWAIEIVLEPELSEAGGGFGIGSFGDGRKLKKIKVYLVRKKKSPKRSEAATEFIEELEELIMETGVVKNTHEPYNSKKNKRYKVHGCF